MRTPSLYQQLRNIIIDMYRAQPGGQEVEAKNRGRENGVGLNSQD